LQTDFILPFFLLKNIDCKKGKNLKDIKQILNINFLYVFMKRLHHIIFYSLLYHFSFASCSADLKEKNVINLKLNGFVLREKHKKCLSFDIQ